MSVSIEEFRARRGDVPAPFAGSRPLLVTTDGAGHTALVAALPDGERTLLVDPRPGGTGEVPGWYRDILSRPRVTVETGILSYPADAEPLEGDARRAVLARAAQVDPAWAGSWAAADGEGVVVAALHDAVEGPPPGPLGQHLVAIHDTLRRELATIRRELPRSGGTGASLAAQLRANCLTFCQWLHLHHTGEDDRIFPLVAQRHPELTGVLARLGEEHRAIATLLDRMQDLLRSDAPGGELAEDFDRLAAELERHLAYEEEQLVPALDQVRLGG